MLAVSGYSQNASHATMRVSVRVISGSSVEIVQPSMVSLTKNKSTALGGIKLKGADSQSTLINVSGNVSLKDSSGKKYNLAVSHSRLNQGPDSTDVSFETVPHKKMIAGAYMGKLTTTIEYF